MLVGRKDETTILQSVLAEDESGFVAVYGRRRIGKTYLVRQVYKNNIVFDCSGLHDKNTAFQLESFNDTLADYFKHDNKKTTLQSWLEAFELLKKYISNIRHQKKKVIFFDEISWFDTHKSGFKAALDKFWNQYATKRKDIVLVICGSAASWIINKIVNDRGGFHNRITTLLELQPFTLQETNDYLRLKKADLQHEDIIRLYMATGGIPFYLKDIKPGQSVTQIIQQLFFSKTAPLKNEFQNLYAALFNNSNWHQNVVKALAAKNKGLTRNEILLAAKLPSGGGLTTVLNELVTCGFIKEIYPINKQKADLLYRLTDNYSIFYFKFLAAQKAQTIKWSDIANTQAYKTWCGYAFENICLQHIRQIKQKLGISGIMTNEYSWYAARKEQDNGVQIDMIIDRNDNAVNLCEMKFYNTSFEMDKSYASKIQHKKELFIQRTKSKKNVFVTLITLHGANPNAHYNSIVANQLTGHDLF
jgi:uncharacterized protein